MGGHSNRSLVTVLVVSDRLVNSYAVVLQSALFVGTRSASCGTAETVQS